MRRQSPPARFVWHELMTDDPDAAIGFYSRVVGWTLTPWDADPGYRQWTVPGGVTVGGVMRLPPEGEQLAAPPHWLFYVGVPDVEQTVRSATARGGRLLTGPVEMMGVGEFAVLSDPQGAVFAVLARGGAPRGDLPPGSGEFSWHELSTTDAGAAWPFYQGLFGWERIESMPMDGGIAYQMFGWKGMSVGGMFTKTPDMPFPPHWVCYVTVPNADAAARRVRSHGGRVLKGPVDIPGGDRIAICLDPQGAVFAVYSTAQVVEARPVRPGRKKATRPARTSRPAKRKTRKP